MDLTLIENELGVLEINETQSSLSLSVETSTSVEVPAIAPATVIEVMAGLKGDPGTGGTGGTGTSDHGSLTGLLDDDHPQYLNSTRGDGRYYTQTQLNTALAGKSSINHTHEITAITNFTESVQEVIATTIVAGANISVSYNDVANTFTINSTAIDSGTDTEIVRDTIAGALIAGSGVQITVNDASDTITIASTAVLPTRSITAGTGLVGGGDLSANRTFSVDFGTTGTTVAVGNHTHDDRYYTEAEVDSLIALRAIDTSVLHLAGTETITGSKTFNADLTLADARNIVVNATTGTKIGTATTQKLGFFNATPVVQQGATTDLGTTLSNLGLRAAGTAYPITTSGAVSMSGTVSLGALTLTSSLRTTYLSLSANTTLGAHHKVMVNATAAAITITLPTAASVAGREYVVTKSDASANAVSVATTSAQTINGAAAPYAITTQWQTVTFVSDGANWYTSAINEKAVPSPVHTHAISDITNLTTELSGKASLEHQHAASEISSGQLDVQRIYGGAFLVVDKAEALYGAAGSWPASRPSVPTYVKVFWMGDTDPGALAASRDIWYQTTA